MSCPQSLPEWCFVYDRDIPRQMIQRKLPAPFQKAFDFAPMNKADVLGKTQGPTQILSELTLQNPVDGFAVSMLIDEKTFACARC